MEDMMQPTMSPWSAPGGVYSRHVRPRPQDWPPQKLNHGYPVIYLTNRGPSKHIIRLEAGVGGRVTPRWAPDRLSLDSDVWRMLLTRDQRFQYSPLTPSVPQVKLFAAPPPTPAPPRAHAWEEVARGWIVGIILLGLLILIVRAAERCMDKTLFNSSRRQSQEWPTPNVRATSQQNHNDSESPSNSGNFPSGSRTSDLPPPYSECATNSSAEPKIDTPADDPPPPYSACYVAFMNPKDGTPSVHIVTERRANASDHGGSSRPDTSTNHDNTQNNNDGADTSEVIQRENHTQIKVDDVDAVREGPPKDSALVVAI